MSEHPITVLMRAAQRAVELHEPPARWVSIFKGAPSHSGAYLLQALDEQGWELRPKPGAEGLEPSKALAERVIAVAHQGVGLDDIHRSLSPAVVLAALQLIEAADLVVMEGETR